MNESVRTNEIVAITMCKKCGQEHPVEEYRTLLFYYCPVVNRILIVSEAPNEHHKSDH